MSLEEEIKLPLVEKSKSNKISSFAVFNTAFNVLLGAGPILVPPVFSEPGIALAFLFIILITFISFACAEFVIETMSILTAIRKLKEEELSSKLINIPSNENGSSNVKINNTSS